jgi:endonuclease/exonuclease/phosphatase family metal-dependent hydrolase
MEWKVMSFNLRYDTPNDGVNQWPYRIDRLAHMMLEHEPLFIGTQEGYAHMLADLQERLEPYAWLGTGRHGGQENEHCAIFYRKDQLELLEQGTFWLSETPDMPASKSWDSSLPRICTWGRWRHRGSEQVITVFNTHLDHLGQEARNQGSLMILKAIVREYELNPTPVILLGDFNSHPTDWPIRLLRGEFDHGGIQSWLQDAYGILEEEIGLTAHSFQGGSEGMPIDYIFVSPDVLVYEVLIDRREVDGGFPSDHYPVIARLGTKEEHREESD